MSAYGERYLTELLDWLKKDEATTARWLHRFDLSPDPNLSAADFSADEITYLHACAITDNCERELEWLKKNP